MKELLNEIESAVKSESKRAAEKHRPAFYSPHESSAIIREELEELEDATLKSGTVFRIEFWPLIKKDADTERIAAVLIKLKNAARQAAAEAVQLAAMADKGLNLFLDELFSEAING